MTFFPEKSDRSDRELPLEVFYYIKVRLYRRENNRFETISDLAIKVTNSRVTHERQNRCHLKIKETLVIS